MITFEEHAQQIQKELDHAKNKHPKFCDDLSYRTAGWWEDCAKHIQAMNDNCIANGMKISAEKILMEELDEAFAAATAGETEHAKQEFYQVCAVALRCIEMLDEH